MGGLAVHRLPYGDYRVFYMIENAEVTVLRVLHGAQEEKRRLPFDD